VKVILWDIDGTLVRSNGGRVAVNAFLRALSVSCALDAEPPYPRDSSGKTDPQIALDILTAAAVEETRANDGLMAFPAAYLEELQQQRQALIGDLRVLPGVQRALEELEAHGAIQSLLTGNLQPVARLKLSCAGLDRYLDFDLGAYGSDHADRDSLVPIVRQRLQRRLGNGASQTEIAVVGDTPRDIACARAGGARAIAVATGNYSRQELEAHQPDAVLDNLSDTDAVVQTLLR
jgi:phosphoglycolate phosphatase